MSADFISLNDYSQQDLLALLDLADDLKRKQKAGELYQPLLGKTIAMLFEKPSLRTRVTFEVGIFQLGGQSTFMTTILGERETVPDMARNLDRWVDGIVARTHSHDAVLELAKYASIPVINALTDELHPCQVLADAQTIREHKGKLDGLKIAFVGDGNNMFASWANLVTKFSFDLVLACPEGYELNNAVHDYASKNALGSYTITNDVQAAVKDADVVYTDVWASMGQEDEYKERLSVFMPYQINADLMALAKDDAVFMHCLPAHRGEEVTDEVMESSQSIVFDEAENRLHAQKAVMVTLMS
ncbi:MAG: ornithine carbamoyltransferase [Candidatus Hydrogenedentota bacterium]|nr:MAG: ornithine carbamoyltransferase [Candidatus Hydrogenedentota bacterium]